MGVFIAGAGAVALATIVPTTIDDFFGPGSQPGMLLEPLYPASDCQGCHSYYDEDVEPFRPWAASMMGQSARDPLFWAALAIAEQDVAFVGDMCIRCHTPSGWMHGNSTPTDGSMLQGADFEGVSCSACHRMVDPVYTPGVSPAIDEQILADHAANPDAGFNTNPHTGQFVMDPNDNRRGPFDLDGFFFHNWEQSPFHQSSSMCATCHDVSNPVYSPDGNGGYALNTLGAAHDTHDKLDQFPIERTYSEWTQSAFAQGPIDMGGRFGGNKLEVSTCQDCHMPDTTGRGCVFEDRPIRDDLPTHEFHGGNTWVLRAVRNLFPDHETYLSESSVNTSIAKAEQMLRNASDLSLSVDGGDLVARVTNMSGHKLPTGYPEGRRMWVNVRFFDEADQLVAERGAYDDVSATLTVADTKVYEAKIGISDDVAALTGKPAGEGFHFALNNTWIKDNRIPPMGFTNAGFASVQAAPVGSVYADGQHWDDTAYAIPAGAARAEVRVFYQTSSREYIEFLRDTNTTNNTGQVAYDQWVATGKSAPVEMDLAEIEVAIACPADYNADGTVNILDVVAFITVWNQNAAGADYNNDGTINILDVVSFITVWNIGCP